MHTPSQPTTHLLHRPSHIRVTLDPGSSFTACNDTGATADSYMVSRCRLTLSNPVLKAPGIKLLKLKYGKPLSKFAFKFNLRRYNMVRKIPAKPNQVGWCMLTPG